MQITDVDAKNSLHTCSRLAPVLDVCRLKNPQRSEQIGNLFLSIAGSAPIPDVCGSRLLNAILKFAYPRVVLASSSSKCPPRETRISPDLTKTGT